MKSNVVNSFTAFCYAIAGPLYTITLCDNKKLNKIFNEATMYEEL